MKIKVLVVFIWVLILLDAVYQGISLPDSKIVADVNRLEIKPFIIVFPFILFLVMPMISRYWKIQNRDTPGFIARWADNKFGDGF